VTVTRSDVTHTILDEPIAILAALNWVNQTASLSHSEYLRQDLGKHSNVGNGFENYFAFYVRSFFNRPQRLAELFKFRHDFDKIIDWKSDIFELVTVSRPEGSSSQPRISIVTPASGPSSNIGFRAATGEDILSWMSTNEGQFTFCLPPEHFGPDLLFFLRSKVSGKLLLVMVQCKNYSDVALGDLTTQVRTVTPDWLWKSKDTKACTILGFLHLNSDLTFGGGQYKTAAESIFPQGSPRNAPDLAVKTMNALREIPFGLTTTNAQFPILRVFASWPADANLDRTNPKPPKTTRKPAGKEDPPRKRDGDLHPLATLHLTNFVRMSQKMDINWFRGLVEQNEVIHLKRSAGEDLDTQKSKRLGGDDMVM